LSASRGRLPRVKLTAPPKGLATGKREVFPPISATGGPQKSAGALRQEDSPGRNPSRKEGHMRKGLILLILAALLFQACADTNSYSGNRGGSLIERANTCATCGAGVSDNYFAGSAFKAVGPGNY